MVNIGDKYIIEVEEVYIPADDSKDCNSPSKLYRIKGFNSLVFDENGLSKIERADEEKEKSYEDGLNDAWEAAKKIILLPPAQGGFNYGQLDSIFGHHYTKEIFNTNTASEAISKIDKYEKDKDKDGIKIGDEVIENTYDLLGVVIKVTPEELKAHVVFCNGGFGVFSFNELKKTGKHYDEIQVLLEKMRGKDE